MGEIATALLVGLALVFVFEGLALALMAGRIERVLELIRQISPERQQTLGFGFALFGLFLLWLLLR